MFRLDSEFNKDRRNLKNYVLLVRSNIHLIPPPPLSFIEIRLTVMPFTRTYPQQYV